MKEKIIDTLNELSKDENVRSQWGFALSQGGAENLIQFHVSQYLKEVLDLNVCVEYKNADIAIFDTYNDEKPSNIIEVGINYLCQNRDAEVKPLKDIFKRMYPNSHGETYPAKSIYSLMFIVQLKEGSEGNVLFPNGTKEYLSKKVENPLERISNLIKYWKEYVLYPTNSVRFKLASDKDIRVDFADIEGLNQKIDINKIPVINFKDYMLHSFIIQIH